MDPNQYRAGSRGGSANPSPMVSPHSSPLPERRRPLPVIQGMQGGPPDPNSPHLMMPDIPAGYSDPVLNRFGSRDAMISDHTAYNQYPRAQQLTPSETGSQSDSTRGSMAGPRPMRPEDRAYSGSTVSTSSQQQVPMPQPAYQQPVYPAVPHGGGVYMGHQGSNHHSAQASPAPVRRQNPQYTGRLNPIGYQSVSSSQSPSPSAGRRDQPVGNQSVNTSQPPSPSAGRRDQPVGYQQESRPSGPSTPSGLRRPGPAPQLSQQQSMETLAHLGSDGNELSVLPSKRYATVRRKVPLKTGNFVVDFPVAERYLDMCGEKEGNEFTHLRYTAVTCDPDEYGKAESGYSLRPKLSGRETELFIVMTMYNEDEELFAKTMTSVQKNIAYLCSDKCPVSWGPNGWNNVVVCIVADGRTKIDKRVLTMLQVMGVYTPGLERTQVENKPVTGHIYEFTTQIAVDKDLNIRGYREGIVPVQVLFCLKEKNAKKINSHRWFFNAFGPILNPNVCVLLDVGTKPTGTSIYHLWRAFDRDPQVGGACGEIVAELGKGCANLFNPLVAAQNFEYKMSNILDKPLESAFGYIQVLPGAFSAYRYTALANSTPTTGPLASYFQGENHTGETDVFKANMYLAEDRILCFELVTKRNQNWILKYVKNARAETDVPGALPELVSQRRRWLNGSFFAAVHSVTNYRMLFRSSHSAGRKAVFTFQEAYNIFNLIFSWFAIGNFYLTFHFLFQGTRDELTDPFNGSGFVLFQVLRYLYLGAIGVLIIISFGNRPQGSKTLYYSILVLFAVLMGFLLFMGGNTVYRGIPKTDEDWRNVGDKLINEPAFRDIIISLGSTYGLYLISSLLHLDPWHCITSMLQYLLLLPVYINVFMVYAFCNLHDISWGTKGDNVAQGATANTAPAVKAKDSTQAEVTVDLPQDDQDILNANYAQTLETLVRRPEKTRSGRDRQTKIDDYFRLYRTRVVLSWIISNVLIIVVFTTDAITNTLYANVEGLGKGKVNPYLTFIFWSVTALSAVRFVGSSWYLVTWLMEGMAGAVTGRRTFVPRTQANQTRGVARPQKNR